MQDLGSDRTRRSYSSLGRAYLPKTVGKLRIFIQRCVVWQDGMVWRGRVALLSKMCMGVVGWVVVLLSQDV